MRASPTGFCQCNQGVAVTAPVDFLERRRPSDLRAGPLLQHRDGIFISPPPINGRGERLFPEPLAVRRVAEDEVEGLKRARIAEPASRRAARSW